LAGACLLEGYIGIHGEPLVRPFGHDCHELPAREPLGAGRFESLKSTLPGFAGCNSAEGFVHHDAPFDGDLDDVFPADETPS